MDRWARLHTGLYNAAFQERIEAGLSNGHYDQQNAMLAIKRFRSELAELDRHAMQETLRRLDRAFQTFQSVTRLSISCF